MSRKIEVQILGDSSSLQRALGKSSAEVQSFGSRIRGASRSVASAGQTLTRGLTFPIVAAGAAAGKLALDFETSMNHVQALTGASRKQTESWSNEILSLSGKLPQAPNELAQALYFVASAGVRASDVMEITRRSAEAAASGLGDTQTVAELVTSAMNAYGKKALSASDATDVLTEAVKIGKAEPAEFAQNLGRVIPLAQSMGVTFAEAAGSVAELTNTGLDAAESVTAIRGVLTSLIKPSSQASEEMHKLGTSADELRQEVKDRGLNATLQDLASRVGDNKTALGKLFPNVRALTGFLALTGKNADKVTAGLDKMNHATGATDKAFRVASQSVEFKMRASLSRLQATAIQVGGTLLPIAADVGDSIAGLVGRFGELDPQMQKIVLLSAGVAAALGPVLRVIGSLGIVAGAAISGLTLLGGGMVALIGIIPGFSVAMVEGEGALIAFGGAETFALGPIGLLAVGIVGIGVAAAGIIAFLSSSSGSTDQLAGASDRARDAVLGLNAALDGAKNAHQAATDARHQETAAALAVKEAEKGVGQALKSSGKKSLAYKEALNHLTLAKDNYRHASASAALAEDHERDVQRKLTATRHRERHAIESLTDAYRSKLKPVIDTTHLSVAKMRGAMIQNQQALSDNRKLAGHAAQDFDKLADAFTKAARQAEQRGNPALAHSATNAAAAARATAELFNQLHRLPTHKEIKIRIETDRFTTYHTARAGPAGHRAAGGPVSAGQSYIVGENRPELFIPNVSGHILPRVPDGGGGGGRWHGRPVQVNVVLDKRVVGSVLVDLDKDYKRQNGRGLFR